jgi:hypothetical protein
LFFFLNHYFDQFNPNPNPNPNSIQNQNQNQINQSIFIHSQSIVNQINQDQQLLHSHHSDGQSRPADHE